MNIRQTPDEFLQRKENAAREQSERALQPMVQEGSQAQKWLQNGGLQDAFPNDETPGIGWQKIKDGWKNAVDAERGKRAARRQRLYQAFSGDPLAAVPGGIENRSKVEARIASSENIDAERKKVALAYYFSKNDPKNIGFVYENIDQFCEEFAGGKATPEQVYDEIAAVVAYQKDLPEDFATYQKWREQRDKTTGFWNSLGGMIGIIPYGFTQYLSNVATAIVTEKNNETQEDGRTNLSHLQEEQWRALQPELHRNTVEWEAEKNRVRREYYRLDAPALETGFGQVPNKPNRLGVYDLPALPGFDTSELSEAASARNKEAEDAWLAVIKRNRDKYPWAQSAKSAAEVQEAYWNEIERRYKEATGGIDTSAGYEELQRKLRVIDARRSGEYERLAAKLNVKEEMEERIRTVHQTLEDGIREQQQKYHPGNLDEDTVAGFWGEGSYGKVAGKSLAIIWDQIALSILPMMATHFAFGEGASTAVFAGAMEGEGYNEADDANLSPEMKLEYARWHAAYEVIPEVIFGWIPILHKMTPAGRGAVREALPNAAKDYFKSFVKGGTSDTFGELLTFCFEKAEDAALGIGLPDGKTSWDDLTGDEKRQFLTSGLVETIIGSLFTAGLGEAWARRGERGDIKAFNLQGERWIQVIEARVAELREKETLEEAEASELRELETVLDNGNFGDFVRVVQREALREAIHTIEKRKEKPAGTTEEAGATESPEAAPVAAAPETGAKTSEDAEEGELEASDRRARELKLKCDLPHNPDDTAAAVDEWKKKFPNIKIETVTEWTPEQLRILRQRGVLYPEKATGQYDGKTDTVILNVSNLRPSEVPFKILHEVGLHAGIRRAFGNDAANNLFRAVFEATQDTDLMQQIIEAYKLRSPLLDENGEAIYNSDGELEYDDMTDAQKCEAAEEYLAFTAETYGVSAEDIFRDNRVEIVAWGRKQGRDVHDLADRRSLTLDWMNETGFKPERPGWWKRLISQIRVWLAQNGFGHLRDADIETIIQKAAKAARERKAVHPDRASRFALIGSSGAISNLGRDNPNREINLDNAEKATRMRDYGYSDKEIWLATGWTRGADGQWRMEIPDLNVKTDELTQGDNYNALIDYNGPLDGYVDAPEIFEAYPQLKQYNVMFIPLPRGEGGYFDRANNTIAINRTLFVDQNFDVLNDMAADMKEAKSQHEADIIHANIKEELDTFAEGIRNTLIHEVQHAIQQIEGFARGGNLEDAKNLPDDLDPMFVRANTQLSELEQRYNDAFDKLIQAEAYLDWSDEMSLALSRYVGSNPKSSDLEIIRNGAAGNPHLDSFIEALEHFKRVDFEKNVANLDVVSSKGSFGRYRRFAGEVEARNAEQRAAMSDERRRETMPSETEDVPRENQIVRFSVDQIESPEFKNWFKDSKVVDKDGKPLVVYHDTNAKIYINKETGENWDELDWKAKDEWENRDDWDQHWIEQDFNTFSRVRARRSVEYPGFFFSPTPDPNHEYGTRRIAAFLSLQNPAINPKIEDAGVYDDSGEKAMLKLIEQGYDGIIRKDDDGNVEEYIAFYPEQIKSVDNVGTFDPNNPDIRYSVSPVWTGSAADFEQPSLHYVGTGEGFQVYGWGLYGSAARDVAEWYANNDAYDKIRKNLVTYFINEKEIKNSAQFYSDNLKGKVGFLDYHFVEAMSIALDAAYMGMNVGNELKRGIERATRDYGVNGGFTQALRYLLDLYEKGEFRVQKNSTDPTGKRNLYKQTFWPDKEENLLDWDEKIPEEQARQIFDALAEMHGDKAIVSFINREREDWQTDENREVEDEPTEYPDDVAREYLEQFLDFYEASGEWVYKQLSDLLGSPKAASEFLYRAGIDGITYIGESSDVRDYVAFSDQDIRVDEHIRFALDIDGNEDLRAYIEVLKPYVPSDAKEHDGAYYAGILKEKAGVEISPETAMGLAEEAVRERRKAKNKKDWKDAYSYFSSANPLFDYVVNSEMVETIRPSHRFEGEDFSGSYISPEFVQYSEKKQRSEYKTERGWRNYLRRREEALARADGAHSDELAKGYVLEHGGDELDVEQQIIDLFRDLKRTDIRSAYSKFKQENFARDIMEQHEYEELMEEMHQREIEDSVISVMSAGQPVVTDDWVAENREVYKELYKQIIGQEAPYSPSKADMEAINAALVQEDTDVSTYAKIYKAARAASQKEALDKVSELRRSIVEGKESAVKLQKAANTLLKSFGLEGDRRFTGRILELMNYQTAARRQKAFDNLMEQIKQAGSFKKKMDLFNRIGERLQQLGRRADTGRKAVGVRDEETQVQIDKIREIAQMSPAEIYERQGELQEAINAATENGDSPVLFEEEMALLGKYGDLINKSAAELTVALSDLNDLAVTGKRKILAALQERAGQDRARINEAIDLINHGEFAYGIERERLENKRNKERRSMKNHALYDLFDSFNLWGKLTALNLASEKDIRETVFYRMQELTHKCARNKDTLNEKHQTDTINAIDKFFGTKGAFQRAAKLNELRKVEKKTGVFRRYLDESGKEFEYSRLSVDEAREMLKDYDRAVAAGARPALEEYAAEAIRHQLRMHERKLDLKKVEFIDGVTEKIMKAANEEGKDADRPIVIPRPKLGGAQEMELSQMQALYQYLMWQQKNTRYKMFFRGWTQESIDQLEAFMLPEVKRFGDWMAAQLDADRKDIDPVYQKLYMTAFPHEEHYFPAVYDNPGVNNRLGSPAGVDLNQAGAGAAPVQYNPGALKMRVFHLGELRLCDALTVFENHRMIMTHFVTHGEAAREIRALFANKDVRRAIEEKHGEKRYQSLTDDIKDFINGGRTVIDRDRVFGKFYSAAVRSKMMINVTSGVKQTLGALTYMQDVPAKEFVSGVSYAMAHPKEVWETLGGTDYFKNRWRSGANYELRMLLDQAGTETGKMNIIMAKADTISSIPLRLGDAGAVLFGGYAVYRYQYQQGIKRGLSEADAKARALLEWEMSTERTQQSNQVHMQNKLQKGTALDRIFTTYLSNQILMWNHYAPRFYKQDWKNGARGMLAMAITSVAMTTANQLFRNGIWVDDWEFWDYFWDFFSDVLSGGGSLGVAAKRSIEATRAYNGGGNVLENDLAKTFRAAKNLPGDISDGESEEIFKDALDLLTAAGFFYQPILPAAAGVREAKKLYKTAQTFNREDE